MINRMLEGVDRYEKPTKKIAKFFDRQVNEYFNRKTQKANLERRAKLLKEGPVAEAGKAALAQGILKKVADTCDSIDESKAKKTVKIGEP